jgi:hypothetical protein
MNHPLALSVILALGLTASLSLFVALKHEFHAQMRWQRKRMEEFSARLEEAWPRDAEGPAAHGAPRPGFNLNRRVQALRMMRRGEDVSHIAAALGVPRQEVELFIRVQQAVKARAARNGS